MSSGKLLQPCLKLKQQLVYSPKGDGHFSKELLGIGEVLSFKALQEVLLDTKNKVDFMFK